MKGDLKLGKVDKIILIGGAPLTARLIEEWRGVGLPVAVVTSPRHLEETIDPQGTTLGKVLHSKKVPFIACEDVNTDPRVDGLLTPACLGLGLGAAWTFEKALVKKFKNRLFDFMGISLPQMRGGAHYTWQILMQDRRGACHVQVVNGGAETFHKGPVVKSSTYLFPPEARIPQDYFEAALPRELTFLQEFFSEVVAGRSFPVRALEESQSSYWPRLHTKTHGWIDWSWSASDIERFICAFDNPYAGASTFLEGRRVHLKGCTLEPSEGGFHPFQTGLIYRASHSAAFVAAVGGALEIRSITDDSGRSLMDKLPLGSRLLTPRKHTEAAAASRTEYDAAGAQTEVYQP